jgi:hypothetical protein
VLKKVQKVVKFVRRVINVEGLELVADDSFLSELSAL